MDRNIFARYKIIEKYSFKMAAFDIYGNYLYLNGFYSFDMNALLIKCDECIFFM